MITYRIGDYLIQLKNAAMAGKQTVTVRSTQLIENVTRVLESEKFVAKHEVKDGFLTATLAMHSKRPIIENIKLMSKPGLRIYMNTDELRSRKDTSSIYILSTPQGVLSSTKAVKQNIGGEVLCEIY
jgi:small subunit ribosomal protein S8